MREIKDYCDFCQEEITASEPIYKLSKSGPYRELTREFCFKCNEKFLVYIDNETLSNK